MTPGERIGVISFNVIGFAILQTFIAGDESASSGYLIFAAILWCVGAAAANLLLGRRMENER